MSAPGGEGTIMSLFGFCGLIGAAGAAIIEFENYGKSKEERGDTKRKAPP